MSDHGAPLGDEERLHASEQTPPAAFQQAIRRYAQQLPELRQVTDQFVAMVTAMLDDAGINYVSVTGRAEVRVFAGKASQTKDGVPAYTDPLTEITDQLGVRVVTYLQGDVAAVADLLAGEFQRPRRPRPRAGDSQAGRFGYSSRRLLVTLDDEGGDTGDTLICVATARPCRSARSCGTPGRVRARRCIQGFSPGGGRLGPGPPVSPSLQGFSSLPTRVHRHPEPAARPASGSTDVSDDDPRMSGTDLAAFLTAQFGRRLVAHRRYSWISGCFLELGITSLDELGGLLGSIDAQGINERMDYRYPAGAVRRLDDALLAVFGPRYIGLHGDSHASSLTARLDSRCGPPGLQHGLQHPRTGALHRTVRTTTREAMRSAR